MIYKADNVIVHKTFIGYCQKLSSFPEDGGSFDMKLISKYIFQSITISAPIIVGVLGHFYQSYLENNMFEIVEDLYYMNYAMLYFSSAVLGFLCSDQILDFFLDLSQIKSEIEGIYWEKIRKFDKITKILYFSAVVDFILISIVSYVEKRYCNHKEHVDDPHYVCGMILPLWYPIAVNEGIRPIVAICCTLFVIFTMPQFAASATLFFSPLFITVRIEHLRNLLKQLEFNDGNADQNRLELEFCIDYYSEITRLVKKMNKSIGFLCALSHNAFNVILIGLCGYLIFRSDKKGIIFFSEIFQLIGWIIVQWISCYTGQCLEDSVSELRDELYDMKWYDMDPSLRSTFKLFQIQMSLPVHFKIQPFPILNNNRFSDLIKGVYSFFMFLQGRNF